MSDHPQDLAARRQRREGAIRATFVASVAGRVLSAGCTIAQVPLALGLLGTEGFGLWALLTSTTLLLSASDLGLGLAMQNEVAAALGREQPQRTPALFLTAFLALASLGLALFAAGAAIAGFVDWGALFHLTQPNLAAGATGGVRAALLLFGLGLPLGAATRLAHACQWGWLASIWNAAGVAGQLAVIALAGRLGLSFPTFVLLTGLPPLLASAALLLHTALRLRWRPAELRLATPTERRLLLHRSWDFCLPQVSAAFIYNAAAPVIGLVAGTTAVTAFNVAQRLFGLLGQLQQMVLAPLWPAYTEAQARRDFDWIAASYRRSLFGSLFGIGLPLVVTALALRWLVDLWTGPGNVVLPAGLVALLCAWNVCLATANAPAYLLGGLGRMRRLGWISFGATVAMAVGMLALGSQWAAEGVIAALVAGYLFIILPATFAEARAALLGLRQRSIHTDHALPGFIRSAIVRLVSGPPRGAITRRYALGIYKVDRLGDFVLALGAIRTLLAHHGADRCLLVISAVAEPLAAAEFPHTPRLVLPVSAGGTLGGLVPVARQHRRRLAGIACDTVVCLRHQREDYHEASLSWLATDRCLKLSPAAYPAVNLTGSADLEAHRRIVSQALGRECPTDELPGRFTAFSPTPADHLLVCPFSFDPTRDIPMPTVLAVLQAWRRTHAGPILLSGSPGDLPRLTALVQQARVLGLDRLTVATPPDQLGFIRQVAAAGTVLSADSAGAHIATALDQRLVVAQGGAFAGIFGPWRRSARQVWVQHPLPCFNCASHCTESDYFCLTRLDARRIADALEEVSR